MTSEGVRKAMMVDYASRDGTFLRAVSDIRRTLLDVADVNDKEWAAILLQGAGTMGIEATINTLTPQVNGKYLLINTGKYSERQRAIVKHLKRGLVEFTVGEGEEIDVAKLEELLKAHPDITNVGYVFHETSTGMIYPAETIGALVRRYLPEAVIEVLHDLIIRIAIPRLHPFRREAHAHDVLVNDGKVKIDRAVRRVVLDTNLLFAHQRAWNRAAAPHTIFRETMMVASTQINTADN
jgi:hypothetical protein